jgi:two-component system OmpR family response regulator
MKILVVDDEVSLLHLLGQHLVRQGHTVETAASVTEAGKLIGRTPAPAYDFALVDWTLPDGTGLDVARDLMERDPRVRVLFTSGYPLDALAVPAQFRNRVRVLQKPFLPRMLGEILNNWS